MAVNNPTEYVGPRHWSIMALQQQEKKKSNSLITSSLYLGGIQFHLAKAKQPLTPEQ